MPNHPPLGHRRGTVVGALFALACLWLGADAATAQSFLRRPSTPIPGATRAAAAPAAAPTARPTAALAARPAAGPAARPTAGRATAPGRPATTTASPTGSRGSAPSAIGAARSGATASAVVRADGASAGDAAPAGGVVQAGRLVATADCRHCGRRGCDACRPGAGRIALACNGRCDAGGCPAHCPVRPEHFGYYPTQWRSWPGQGVRQVSHFDPATTPVVPPRSQLPTLDEEAGVLPDEEAEDAGPADGGAAEPAAALPDAAPVPAPRGADVPPDRAPASDVGIPFPEAGVDGAMPEGSRAAPRAPDAAGDEPASEDGAAIRAAAQRDAASVLLSPRRAAPARPTGAWRPTVAPRDRAERDDTAAVPQADDAAVAPARPAEDDTTSANPLRPAERDAEREPVDRRPPTAVANGWRAARRGAPGDDAEATLRGVTANPGNPLR